ncbi:MAG: Holliday junction ATP-dependent DNA helicase RuvA [Paracoccaceae bacterium]|nr:MAG: Holliday junction ATP-dependent DNA helicase RuvA [Paracoccaceae bacterium]
MIGLVRGHVVLRGTDHVLIDTGGVGYVVHCAERTLAGLPAPGGVAVLYTELIVREDLLQLLGFPSPAEREFWRMLTTVQGVGARLALAISGHLGPETGARVLALGDVAAVRAVPGVGPKLAQRVVAELREKAPLLMALPPGQAQPAMVPGGPGTLPEPAAPAAAPPARMAGPAPDAEPQGRSAIAEALSALVHLGYPTGEAAAAVAACAEAAPDADTAGLIRAALRRLAPGV